MPQPEETPWDESRRGPPQQCWARVSSPGAAGLAGVDPDAAAKIQEVAESMSSDHQDASDAIEEHAEDECDIDLSAS